MPIQTLEEYLQRWGLTPQRPLTRPSEQKPEGVEAWSQKASLVIAEHPEAEDAEIHSGDETGIRQDCQHGCRYAPAGKTPVPAAPGSRFAPNIISTVSKQGEGRPDESTKSPPTCEVLFQAFENQ